MTYLTLLFFVWFQINCRVFSGVMLKQLPFWKRIINLQFFTLDHISLKSACRFDSLQLLCIYFSFFPYWCTAPSVLTFKWVSIQHKCDHLYSIQCSPILRWLLLGAIHGFSNRGEKADKILSIYIFLWLIFMQIRARPCSHLTWIMRIIKDKLSITYLKNRL